MLFVGCKTPNIKNDVLIITPIIQQPKIKIEFITAKDNILKYPKSSWALKQALNEWVQVLPIEVYLYQSNQPSLNNDITKIYLSNFEENSHLLGFWSPKENEICFNIQLEKEDPLLAKQIFVHEIGHFLGLPHIIEDGLTMGKTGDIIVADATKYIMFPFTGEENKCSQLSTLEIKLALVHLYELRNSR